MSETSTAYLETPIGWLEVQAGDEGILSVNFVENGVPVRERAGSEPLSRPRPAALESCLAQLAEYFAGSRASFSVSLALDGTAFQRRVWEALIRVPYGKTTTYRDLAEAVGNVRATRAVGGANHSNPVSIIVPCHRVVGSRGDLTGYGGGLWRKEWLLGHEKRHARD